jgi:hypothetical protein
MKASFFMEQEGDFDSGKCVCYYKFLWNMKYAV